MNNNPKNKTSSSSFLKTDGGETKSNAIEIPSISLPKGGGALKAIDEKFEVNAANGTASFNIPLHLSPNRNGFTPQLSLSYNSGTGNSFFGIGWDLGLPAIQRRLIKSCRAIKTQTILRRLKMKMFLCFRVLKIWFPF